MIDGEIFMLLNKQNLEDSPFRFPDGFILLIEDLIKKLKVKKECTTQMSVLMDFC
uniref:Uncharacterized protein n=1 Tax=Rhizophagus irregularis (strain DAOM 181602 / DAOM 197198 / MUCL 43194) TaxID=747089 RepID=U9SMQ3_RHIID